MIGVSSSSRSFRSLAAYLVAGRSGEALDRVDWSASRNLPTSDPELAAKIMRATAAQNVRVQNPVYHLALSFDPDDRVDRALMERVADRVTSALNLQGHQVLIVAHRDRAHPHMHLLVNRVHPESGKVWNRWQDQTIVQQVLREEERNLGLRQVQGRLTPREDVGSERTVDTRTEKQTNLPAEESANRRAEADQAGPQRTVRVSRVDELASALREYEYVCELSRQQYLVEVDVAAARTRAVQLDSAAERVRAAEDAFRRALDRMYREPESAHAVYVATAGERGTLVAVHLLREQPEVFGALLSSEKRTRAFGLLRTEDHDRVRMDARAAAMAASKVVEAGRVAQLTTPSSGDRPQVELSTAHGELDRVTAAERSLRAELRQLPNRAELEKRIGYLSGRFSSHELGRLERAVTPGQFAVIAKLKAAIRDAALGKDDARNQ